MSLAALKEFVGKMNEEQRQEACRLAAALPVWVPLPGPQTMAYESEADVIGYGGAAGGGKTDLAIGMALTKHQVSAIFRREGTQLTGIIERLAEIIGNRNGYSGQRNIWRLDGMRRIDFGSTPNPGDENKYQGRPKDFLVLDEAPNFLESQARFLMGWVRTTQKGQKCQTLLPFNPPTSDEGQWVVKFFAPWLDPQHPNPASNGEIRWFATIDGEDREVDDGTPFEYQGDLITPQSRTFISSHIADNPFLAETGYMSTLQALPEPLRSQMLKGDFLAGMTDDVWQVIPSAWVQAAMDRWKEDGRKGEMTSCGADIARGGRDKTVVANRYGTWYAPLVRFPGSETPDGPTAAGLIISSVKDEAPIHVDVIGVGGSVYDHLRGNGIQAVGINGAESAGDEVDKATKKLKFRNQRALLYWRFREALDPKTGANIALPPDSKLKADLTCPRWKLTPQGIQIESKEEIIKRLGRSPDDGDAVVYAWKDTMKLKILRVAFAKSNDDYDPLTFGLGRD